MASKGKAAQKTVEDVPTSSAAAASADEVLEADPSAVPEEEEDDSTYGTSLNSDTTSVASAVTAYKFENGRRYAAPWARSQYLLPNDDAEQDRLDFLHHIYRQVLDGGLCRTEIPKDTAWKVLDVGTGTGIWAIEVGDQYPATEVLGVDISPIQPRWVPVNVRFEVDDVSKPWTFPEGYFNFIHVRSLGGSLDDWPAFLAECYKHLAPGGTLEVSEVRTRFWCDDSTFPADSATQRWQETFWKLAAGMGREFDVSPLMKEWMTAAGLEARGPVEFKLPVGTWPKARKMKELGLWFREQFLTGGMETYTLALFTRSGWKLEEVQVLLAEIRNEVKSNKMHIYSRASFNVGTKPATKATG